MRIFTVTLSPVIDRYAALESLAPFREHTLEDGGRFAGGKGLNTARALLSYGMQAEPLLVLGRENKNEFSALLPKDFFPLVVETKGRVRENLTLLSDGGKETRFSFGAPKVENGILDRVFRVLSERGLTDAYVSIGGKCPAGLSETALVDFAVRLQKQGARLLIDSRSYTREMIGAIKPYFIKPNGEEIEAYGYGTVAFLSEAAEAAKGLHLLGCQYAMVSLGGEGAALASSDGCFIARAPSLTPRSTVGAGDSAIGGFLYASARGLSPKERLAYAIAFGSAACLTEGTAPPRREDIDRFLPSIKAKII